MALEGRIDEVAATLEKDADKLAGGAFTLAIFAAIALLTGVLSGSFSTVVNLLLGLLIGGPMIYKGAKRLERSIKLLNPKEPAKLEPAAAPLNPAKPEPPVAALPAVSDTDPLPASSAPVSVIEHTTRRLKRTE